MAAVLATSAANAYDDGIKKKCLENPDKVVWIESRGACIPRNPCENNRFEAYCSRVFEKVQLETTELGEKFADMYVKEKLGLAEGCTTIYSYASSIPGNTDWVECHIGDKNFIEFTFDDMSENFSTTYNLGIIKAICAIKGNHWSDAALGCVVDNETQCQNFNSEVNKYMPDEGQYKYNNDTKLCE
jgi:hypothetical protein